ncbi:MAG: putative metal-binding motif-containing protein [bacterium]
MRRKPTPCSCCVPSGGRGAACDCDDADPALYPGADEVCDGADNDCDGHVDEGFDQDADGTTTCGGDCDDAHPGRVPGRSSAATGSIRTAMDGGRGGWWIGPPDRRAGRRAAGRAACGPAGGRVDEGLRGLRCAGRPPIRVTR